jgi:hypothetical protein
MSILGHSVPTIRPDYLWFTNSGIPQCGAITAELRGVPLSSEFFCGQK